MLFGLLFSSILWIWSPKTRTNFLILYLSCDLSLGIVQRDVDIGIVLCEIDFVTSNHICKQMLVVNIKWISHQRALWILKSSGNIRCCYAWKWAHLFCLVVSVEWVNLFKSWAFFSSWSGYHHYTIVLKFWLWSAFALCLEWGIVAFFLCCMRNKTGPFLCGGTVSGWNSAIWLPCYLSSVMDLQRGVFYSLFTFFFLVRKGEKLFVVFYIGGTRNLNIK